MLSVPLFRSAAIALLVAATPVAARAADEDLSTPTFESTGAEQADGLKPGHYIWHPEEAENGPMLVVVSIPRQRAYVYRSGALIGIATASTGSEGHETPVGRFEILQKDKDHRSNKYSDAPMPFMQRLNWEGVALHGGQVPGHPASHGCIRVPTPFAKLLFEQTKVGDAVYVTDADVEPDEALALAQAHSEDPLPEDRARATQTAAAE